LLTTVVEYLVPAVPVMLGIKRGSLLSEADLVRFCCFPGSIILNDKPVKGDAVSRSCEHPVVIVMYSYKFTYLFYSFSRMVIPLLEAKHFSCNFSVFVLLPSSLIMVCSQITCPATVPTGLSTYSITPSTTLFLAPSLLGVFPLKYCNQTKRLILSSPMFPNFVLLPLGSS